MHRACASTLCVTIYSYIELQPEIADRFSLSRTDCANMKHSEIASLFLLRSRTRTDVHSRSAGEDSELLLRNKVVPVGTSQIGTQGLLCGVSSCGDSSDRFSYYAELHCLCVSMTG